MKYKLIVDCGKPYDEEFKTLKEVLYKLKKIKEDVNFEDFPYLEIVILENNKDITSEIFKNYSFTFEEFFKYINDYSDIGTNDCSDFKGYWENFNTNKLNLHILKGWLK